MCVGVFVVHDGAVFAPPFSCHQQSTSAFPCLNCASSGSLKTRLMFGRCGKRCNSASAQKQEIFLTSVPFTLLYFGLMPRFRVFSTLVLLRAMKADSRSMDWWLCVTCARAAPVHQRVVTLQLLNSGGLWRCVAAHLQVADMQLDSIRVLRLRVQNPALFSAASAHLSLPPSHPYSFLPSIRPVVCPPQAWSIHQPP